MKKVLSLVLALAMVMSLGATFAMAAPDSHTNIELIPDNSLNEYSEATVDDGVVYIGAGTKTTEYKLADSFVDANGNPIVFGGPSSSESVSYGISHSTSTAGATSGTPKGVNGEDLITVRIGYDRDKKAYAVNVTFVSNPTVEIFYNVTVTVKFVKVVDKVRYEKEVLFFGESFDLMNKRYTSKDVFTDAHGNKRIDATGSNYPVVDASAFDKAYGSTLIIDYPNYIITFGTVKNQDVSLNLQAKVEKNPTVVFDGTKPIMTATFHDIYIKDGVKIEFKVNADVQNYKGTTLYAYELDANGNIVKEKEMKITVTANNTIVAEIAAGGRLSAAGKDAKLGTIAIFGEPQEPTSSTTTSSSKNENATTGASDVINVVSVFAVVSLAAAGFVAVNKAGKK